MSKIEESIYMVKREMKDIRKDPNQNCRDENLHCNYK